MGGPLHAETDATTRPAAQPAKRTEATMTLRTRKPTGIIPWPLILIEGGEKVGKSYAAAELSASAKVGQTYWLDLGEGTADEYGAIPGARYQIVEHDGTWKQIFAAVVAVRDLAAKAHANSEPPTVLVIDSMTAEWDLLKAWAQHRARERAKERARKNGRKIADDAEPTISMDLWNDANDRHRKLMTILMTFPGIVVMTARGKWVTSMDDNGRPIENSREYKVEGQKNLAYDASVWIRLSRDHKPMVIGARSVHAGVRPGFDDPSPMPDFTLERVVFDVLRCNPAQATTRDLVNPQGEEPEPQYITQPQIDELMGLLKAAQLNSRELAMPFINDTIAPEQVTKTVELTVEQAGKVLARLRTLANGSVSKVAAEVSRMQAAADQALNPDSQPAGQDPAQLAIHTAVMA